MRGFNTLFNEQAAGESSEGCCEDEPVRAYSWKNLAIKLFNYCLYSLCL